ncbi:MAG TPA: c-type cytochrome [Bryobacteraceae bacterium]|nr:c-type cytochrome [Bryobacteraceae bacterium]
MRVGPCLAASVLALCAFAQTKPEADPLAKLTPDDIQAGKKAFESQCALCHGIGGTGGRGPSLTRAKLRNADTNQALVDYIADGDQRGGMPAFWFLAERQIAQIAAYVRSLGAIEGGTVSGDPDHGRAVYESKACQGCHTISGKGSGFGPELTDIGAKRNPDFLRQAILAPNSAVPEGFALIRAVPREGSAVTGIRVNEDTFTIQVKDASGRFHSFRKSELAELTKQLDTSPMPAYKGNISDGDLTDLIAYLASLKGEK